MNNNVQININREIIMHILRCNFPVNYEGTKNNNLISKGINPLIGNYKNFGVKEIEVFLVKYEEKI